MKRLLLLILLTLSFLFSYSQFYVAPWGDDSNVGSFNEPWKTWNKGFVSGSPGDTIYFMGGVYYSTQRVGMQPWTGPRFFSHYTRDSVVYMGYPPDVAQGNYPILDCSLHSQIPKSPYNPRYNTAIALVNVECVTMKDLQVRNVYTLDGILSPAIAVIGNNITYENITIENAALGFWHVSTSYFEEDSAMIRDILWQTNHEYFALTQIVESRLHHSDTTKPSMWWDTVHFRPPDSSRWINCDVHHISDTLSFGIEDKYNDWGVKVYSQFNDFMIQDTGKFGDAFKVQGFNGNYYLFEGCRAWDYSGDGFDVRGGKKVFKNSWAMPGLQHENADGFVTSAQQSGLLNAYDNAYSTELQLDTLTYFENCLVMFALGRAFRHGISSDVGDRAVYLNNTAYMSSTAFTLEVMDTNATYYNNLEFNTDTAAIFASTIIGSKNSWEPSINPTNSDFVSLDPTTLENLFTANRDSLFQLPNSLPLMLALGSTLIDAGVDVGLDFNGSAPDIGYSESNYGEINQNISLSEGWNIASFYVEPDTLDMLNIVSPLIQNTSLVKVQDEGGGFVQNIQPYGWMNTIGPMSNEEGYYFYVNQPTNLYVSGIYVSFPYVIQLQEGWNMIGHPVSFSIDAMQVFQPLMEDTVLIKAIDEQGNFIQNIPPYGWLNTIGHLQPNEGYLVKVTQGDSLSYDNATKSNSPYQKPNPKTECFAELPGNPFMPMNILVSEIETIGFEYEYGDELAAYDGDLLVGSIIIDTSLVMQNLITRADDPTTNEIDGFIEGNSITFKYCDKSANQICSIVSDSCYWGDSVYTKLGTYIGNISVTCNLVGIMYNDLSNIVWLGQNRPNPFSNTTEIDYNISLSGYVSIIVYDMFGREIGILEQEDRSAGMYTVSFEKTVPGIYYYQLVYVRNGSYVTKTKKMIIE